MFLIRTDGNPSIGTGHIMRCLSLADAIQKCKENIVFVTVDSSAKDIVEQRGYECIILQTKYNRLEDELPILLPWLKKFRPNCVLLDSYFVTSNYMKTVQREVPLIYMDDLNTFDYPADLVINYMLYAKQFVYPPNKRYLLGPKYALLRKEFQDVPKRTEFGLVRHVLVSAGGADPGRVTLECIRYLLEHEKSGDFVYHIILGSMNQDTTAIENLSEGQGQIVLHRQITDMCSLMQVCDVAISAGGTTLFELCACGVPTVTYVLADNQMMNAAAFAEAGLMLNAGDIRGDVFCAERLFKLLDTLVSDCTLRRKMAGRMQNLIDGHGAERLAEKICGLF